MWILWFDPRPLRAAVIGAVVAASCASVLELRPEQTISVHVGQVVSLPAESNFSVGSAGDALRLLKQTDAHGRTKYVYRAVTRGQQTFVLTPAERGPDGCVSCVTIHYLVTVE
jgi:hypothetical protein